jgi:predicted phage tail protein
VTDNVGTDGIDTIRNVERLRFTDQTVVTAVPNAPTNVTATVGNRRATVTWTAPTGNGAQIASYDFVVKSGATVISTTSIAPATTRTVTGLNPGQKYTFEVRGVNQFGNGPFGVSNEITAAGAPNPPTALQAVRGNGSATLSWTPGADNSSAITSYTLQIRNGATVVETRTLPGNVSSAVISGLNNGTAYNFRLIAINGVGSSVPSVASNTVTPATVPGLVQIGAPTQGPAGGALTASANWNPPLSTGGANITGYRVQALRMAADGTVESVQGNVIVGANIRTRQFTLPAGTYRFDVSAINAVGEGPAVRSEAIAAR